MRIGQARQRSGKRCPAHTGMLRDARPDRTHPSHSLTHAHGHRKGKNLRIPPGYTATTTGWPQTSGIYILRHPLPQAAPAAVSAVAPVPNSIVRRSALNSLHQKGVVQIGMHCGSKIRGNTHERAHALTCMHSRTHAHCTHGSGHDDSLLMIETHSGSANVAKEYSQRG